ncbi:hypothetical protein [Neisseria yangbaofengii]|uniref:hypothetical protein n=1 Tax=Neisseria yangbaofengii TaxID=2709396 RepID=UPI0013EC54C1|nr:hypothetical protein [Neisseria yangbaofengii]
MFYLADGNLADQVKSQKKAGKTTQSDEAKLLKPTLDELEQIAQAVDSAKYRLDKAMDNEYKN